MKRELVRSGAIHPIPPDHRLETPHIMAAMRDDGSLMIRQRLTHGWVVVPPGEVSRLCVWLLERPVEFLIADFERRGQPVPEETISTLRRLDDAIREQ
jgi:hypothetical protein